MHWLNPAMVATLIGVFVVLLLRVVFRRRRRAEAYGIERWKHSLVQLRDGIGIRDSHPQAAEESSTWPPSHVRLLRPPGDLSNPAVGRATGEPVTESSGSPPSNTHSADAATQT
jgi:hypothetical protein